MKKTDISDTPLPPAPLKPIVGLSPRIYVTALWGSGFLLLLWILLPLLFAPQSSLIVTSAPAGTPVFWQEEFLGHTPLKVKITPERRGSGQLTLERSGFKTFQKELTLSSWSFPLSLLGDQKVETALELIDREALLNEHLREISHWSSLGEPTASRPTPPLFTRFVRDFAHKPDLTHLFLEKGLPLIDNSFLWADFWTAYQELFAPEFMTPWDAWADLLSRFSLPSTALGAFYSNSTSQVQSQLRVDERFQSALATDLTSPSLFNKGYPPQPLAALPAEITPSFEVIQGGWEKMTFPTTSLGSTSPMVTDIYTPPFYLSRTPVTKYQVEAFLSTNNLWRPEYRESLADLGLADENYLKDSRWETLRPQDPAVFVSQFMAQAYADWLNRTVLRNTGLRASLPTTFQWRLAARDKETPTPEMALGVWYWMQDPTFSRADWYRTRDLPLGIDPKTSTLQAEIRSARNSILNLRADTPASLPRHWTAPHLSFYLVIQGDNTV